jgi:hypothetical protein
MPEREAQAHLGHGSTAVHRAYAKRAVIVTLPLEHYEDQKTEKLIPFKSAEQIDRCLGDAPSAPRQESKVG